MKKVYLFFLFLLWSSSAYAIHVVSKEANVDIRTDKVIHLESDFTPVNALKWAKEGIATEKLPGDRVILINSSGGSAEVGSMFINAMLSEVKEQHIKVICVVEKTAASMAANLLSFCDTRLSVPRSHFLFHHLALVGPIMEEISGRLTAKNLRSMATELEVSDTEFSDNNQRLLKMSKEDYDMFCDKEHVFSAESLLERGYLNGFASIEK